MSDVQPSNRRVGEALESLEQVIASRKGGDAGRSYTALLLAGGAALFLWSFRVARVHGKLLQTGE